MLYKCSNIAPNINPAPWCEKNKQICHKVILFLLGELWSTEKNNLEEIERHGLCHLSEKPREYFKVYSLFQAFNINF